MSSTATAILTLAASVSTTPSLSQSHSSFSSRTRTTTFLGTTTTTFHITPLSFPSSSSSSSSSSKPTSTTFHGFKRFSPVMEWQDCTVKREIDVPVAAAYNCYLDREAIPNWMPFISSVKILPDKPDLSRWSLKYKAFGRDIEFAWLARNMQPIPNQKIHWRSLEGLPNKGAVRFFPKGPSSSVVELTVSYEVPQILAPVASALKPFLEGLLDRGLERFARFAKSYKS